MLGFVLEELLIQQNREIDRLTLRQVMFLRGIFGEVQSELNTTILSRSEWQYNRLIGAVDSAILGLEARAQGYSAEEALELGLEFSQPIIKESIGIPGDSLFFTFQPNLRFDIIKQSSEIGIGKITNVSQDLKRDILQEVRKSLILGEGTLPMMERITGVGLEGTTGKDGVFRRAKWRAELIARTTTNELVNKGSLEGYKETNNEFPELGLQKVWESVGDGRTSPICQELAGQIVGLEDNFESSRFVGQYPPAHPNALVDLNTELLLPGSPSACFWKDDVQIFKITTRSGKQLVLTGDHPVYIAGVGWVFTKFLKEGMHTVSYISPDRFRVSPNSTVKETTLKSILELLNVIGEVDSRLMPVPAHYLNNDISNQKVVTIISDPVLVDCIRDYGKDNILKFLLVFADLSFLLSGEGSSKSNIPSDPVFLQMLSDSRMMEIALGNFSNLSGAMPFLVESSPEINVKALIQQSRLLMSSKDAHTLNVSLDSRWANSTVNFGNLSKTMPHLIQTDPIVHIERSFYSGMLYHVESLNNWYFANGIITQNCRSRVSVIGEKYRRSWEKTWKERKEEGSKFFTDEA